MKKFILFIAFLAIGIGSAWADDETFQVKQPSGTFIDLNSMAQQTCTLTWDSLSAASGEYEYFSGVSFTASVDVASLSSVTWSSVTCTLSVKVGTTQVISSGPVQISVTGQTVKIPFGKNVNFANGNDLEIEVTVTLPNVVSDNNTWSNPTLYGSRAVSVQNEGNTYIVHTGARTSTLTKFAKSSEGKYFISRVEGDGAGSVDSSNVVGGYYSLYEFGEFKFNINGNDLDISLTEIGNEAFKNFTVSGKSAFVLPNTVKTLGSGSGTNECFKFSNGSNEVLVIFDYSLDSPAPTFKNFVTNTTVSAETRLMLGPSATFSFDRWPGGDTLACFSGKGKSWHPFQVTVTNMHENNDEMRAMDGNPNGAAPYIKVERYPWGNDIQLKVSLVGDKMEGAHDGTWCDYYEITDAGYKNKHATVAPDGRSFQTIVDGSKRQYYVNLNYRNYLIYGKGQPFFDAAADGSKIADSKLCYKSQGVTFKCDINSPDNVPYWKYTNVGSTSQSIPPLGSPSSSLTIDCPVYVEKEITSEHYRYFSLPFDCKVSDITVYKIENGAVTNDTIPLLENEPSDWNSTFDKDYFVINQYVGQLDTLEGMPNYKWINSTTDNGVLSKNKGYAFALVEAIEDNHIEALITFKSQNAKNELYLNTYNELTIPVQYNNSNATLAQNKGWNMIGNPFYHYLKPNSFFGTSTTGEGEEEIHQVKYISLINDDETVTHYWVNPHEEDAEYKDPTGTKVTEEGQATTILWIKPFQAFFVQVGDGTSTINVYPKEGTNPFAYTSQVSIAPENRGISRIPAEEEEIQEHLSVKVTGQNGSFDRTTVINDETRDEHFKMMDDLSKIMNPGIQIYTWYDSVPCAFKELPMRADSTMAIPLGVRVEEAGNYTFALDTNLTFFYGAAMLHDKQMNQYHPLNEDGVQVSLTEGTDNARFELVIVPSEIPADVENVETSETLDAYVHDGCLVVENIEEGSTLSIFDVTGKMLYSAPAVSDFNYQFSAHGVYMVVLQGNTTGSIKVVY